MKLKEFASGLEQFGSVAQIPVGIFRSQVAEVHSQVWQQLLHIPPLAIPKRESRHCERVSERMQRRSPLAWCAADAGTLEQPEEHHSLRVIAQVLPASIREERLHLMTA